tara:strand:+ start:4488 stop:4907 length:420 start_codon:yes stop_codon:yes gene_type:complete
MVSYSAIRDGLAVRLRTLDTFLVVHSTVPGATVAPCAVIVPGSPIAGYHESMQGSGGQLIQFNFDVLALVQAMAEEYNQDTLDALISGADSVPSAIEADQTLGGVSAAVVCTAAVDYGSIRFADSEYVGARFKIEVYAR